MSTALVPGRIRRLALASKIPSSILISCELDESTIDGDLGPIWISVGGGGLGSRGELGGRDMLQCESSTRVETLPVVQDVATKLSSVCALLELSVLEYQKEAAQAEY